MDSHALISRALRNVFRFPLYQQLGRARQEKERTLNVPVDQRNVTQTFHAWDPNYVQIIRRPKSLKPMTKDPYSMQKRLMTTAVLGVTTEDECCLPLIPAAAVKTQKVTMYKAPRPICKARSPSDVSSSSLTVSVPTVVRYLRRNQLLPSERAPGSIPVPPAPEYSPVSRRPSEALVNTKKTVAFAPALTGTDRLLYRDQLRKDVSAVRRPTRKLVVNASHETILPVAVYG